MEIFGFEVHHEYIIEYVEAFEHNSWTFEVHFDTFSVVQTVWGILYVLPSVCPPFEVANMGEMRS